MRKITQQAVMAFNNYEPFKKANTRVEVRINKEANYYYSAMFLHDNRIARMQTSDNTLWITLCGWDSLTTRERLNGVISRFGFLLAHDKGVTYLYYWDGLKYRNIREVAPNDEIEIIGLGSILRDSLQSNTDVMQ